MLHIQGYLDLYNTCFAKRYLYKQTPKEFRHSKTLIKKKNRNDKKKIPKIITLNAMENKIED